MKKSNGKSNGAEHAAHGSQRATVSERKLRANRENAKKSTGPKTFRGKAFSRRNAIKHGIFRQLFDDMLDNEDLIKGQDNYRHLRNELKPVGPSEENVVEYIAIGWQKLERLYRYENAEIESGMAQVSDNIDDGIYDRFSGSQRSRDLVSLLQTAAKDIRTRGHISRKSMGKISEYWELQLFWPNFQAAAEKTAKSKRQELAISIAESRKITVSEARELLARDPQSLPEYVRFVTLETVREASRNYGDQHWNAVQRQIRIEYQQCLVPNAEKVDKIIRYGNAIERQLSRAYQWLYTLQQQRLGKSAPAALRPSPVLATSRCRSGPPSGPGGLLSPKARIPAPPARLI